MGFISLVKINNGDASAPFGRRDHRCDAAVRPGADSAVFVNSTTAARVGMAPHATHATRPESSCRGLCLLMGEHRDGPELEHCPSRLRISPARACETEVIFERLAVQPRFSQ